ncbi:MAG: hypothetical protein ACUZ8I_17745 [Candidatus Scalindua sp.]
MMGKEFQLVLAVMFFVGMTQLAVAGEHGGSAPSKGSTSEHGGTVSKAPSNDDIRNAMKSYVTKKSKASGTFDVLDPDTGKMLNLELVRVHERVGKTGDYYYSCADFKEKNAGVMWDLDLDVEALSGGGLQVVDVRVHKEDGDARYTYDENDNRIPLKKGTKSHLGKKGSEKESGGKEHGGKEHGGS